MTTFKSSLFHAWLYRKYDFVKSQIKHSTQKTTRLGISKILSTILSPSKLTEELSFCHKLWIYNPYFFGTQCRTSLIFQTYIIWSNRIHILKYLRSTTLESKDTRARKVKFVAKTQVPWKMLAAIFLIWKQLPLRCMWGPTKKLFSREKKQLSLLFTLKRSNPFIFETCKPLVFQT